jgi:hypothetical protein
MIRALLIGTAMIAAETAAAADEPVVEVHAQATYLRQFKPPFNSPYAGQNSLGAARATSYSFTSTLYVGANLGRGWEIYLNPEFTQGVPFSQLRGTGGFTNGELARTSGAELRGYFARAFARKTWDLGGGGEDQASEANQVATRYASERIVLTAGTLSVLDLFDAVDYSRDARTQFMNWSSLTYGAWDFPADARGYTEGLALEYISPAWSLRAGRFAMPVESNGLRLDDRFARRHGDMAEFELPFKGIARGGVLRILAFRNRAEMGAFRDAIAVAGAAGTVPDLTLIRRLQSKKGIGVGAQLELTEHVGAYARAAFNDGKTETFAFTEIDRSLAAGVLAKGSAWGRADDSAGLAIYLNGLSAPHRDYLAAGGLGFFLGDGRLSYGGERIVETFYSLGVAKGASLSLGYQRIANPGYNRDRGPANFLGVRMHLEI